jgi:hypothetical protein
VGEGTEVGKGFNIMDCQEEEKEGIQGQRTQ